MAELAFYYGTMNCGKSTLALQMAHNRRNAGKGVLLYTMLDREEGRISSRIGLSQPAAVITAGSDLLADVREHIAAGQAVDELICDEAQFYTPAQIDQLARIVDELDVDVTAFGLLSDFTSHLFAGSKRLLEVADVRQELQVQALCWCGEKATYNARTVDGRMVRHGEQVVVGDVDDDAAQVAYEVLCRVHYRQGVTREAADRRPEVTAAP